MVELMSISQNHRSGKQTISFIVPRETVRAQRNRSPGDIWNLVIFL
jgi:hypothetical protein